jgi:hypothetical protein
VRRLAAAFVEAQSLTSKPARRGLARPALPRDWIASSFARNSFPPVSSAHSASPRESCFSPISLRLSSLAFALNHLPCCKNAETKKS